MSSLNAVLIRWKLRSLGLVPAMAELLIDAEADPALRAVLVGALRESGR